MSAARNLLASVLVAATLVAATLAGCASATPTPSPSPSATATPEPTASPSPTPTPEPSPTPIPLDQEMLSRRLTVLVVGLDSNASRRAAQDPENTDALMVVSVSADRSRIDVLSLPRDTVDIPMADGSTYHRKINSIAPKLGMEALRGGMATMLGVRIDRYVEIDMDDFVWMVDAMGGILIDVPAPISDPKVHLRLAAGPITMDGATALAYSRTRADSDYGRAARQQQVVLALVRAWLTPHAGVLIGAAMRLRSVQTDISITELPTLLEIGRRSAEASVKAIVLKPPRFSLFVGFEPNSTRGWVMIPNVAEMRRYARSALAD